MAEFRWNYPGFRDVRTSAPVMRLLDSYATSKAAACGDGYEAKPAAATGGRGRGRAAVVAWGKGARREAQQHLLARP